MGSGSGARPARSDGAGQRQWPGERRLGGASAPRTTLPLCSPSPTVTGQQPAGTARAGGDGEACREAVRVLPGVHRR